MSRRKSPNPDEASDAEDTRLAHRREVDAVIAEMLAEAAAPVQDDGVRVLVGDAQEDAEDYAARRAELAHAYGVVAPLEEMLVDRVAALAWRLNRLQRVERGAVTVRTESAAKAEHRRREHDAIRQRTENVARGRPAAEDDSAGSPSSSRTVPPPTRAGPSSPWCRCSG